MTPGLRDCLERIEVGNLPEYIIEKMELLLEKTLVEGVKIGGVYRHWKGDMYLVTDVVRDADDWHTFKVVYCQVSDARHRAERRVNWFLGDMDDERNRGPRFRLVG